LHYNAIDYGCCGDNLPLPQFDENGISMSQKEGTCLISRPGSEAQKIQ